MFSSFLIQDHKGDGVKMVNGILTLSFRLISENRNEQTIKYQN